MSEADQDAERSSAAAEEPERTPGGIRNEQLKNSGRGAAVGQDPPEIGLNPVQSYGMLVVRQPERLAQLVAPWCAAAAHDEVLVELKMAGDKLDAPAVERALLRRQARQVQRVEEAAREKAPWPKEEPLWVVAPHVPAWLRDEYELTTVAPGCYRVGPARFEFLWIAANELPLEDHLVAFLNARSGRALDEFARWVAPRRPKEWVMDMLRTLPISTDVREELLKRFGPDDAATVAEALR